MKLADFRYGWSIIVLNLSIDTEQINVLAFHAALFKSRNYCHEAGMTHFILR